MNQFVSKLLCGLIPDCRENQAGREELLFATSLSIVLFQKNINILRRAGSLDTYPFVFIV